MTPSPSAHRPGDTDSIPTIAPADPPSDHAVPAAPQTLPSRTVASAISILALSAFVMILNETVLSVALPELMSDFDVTATTAQWLTTGFLLTMAAVIPMTGFLLQRFTLRALFLAAVTIFLLGTVLAAFAPAFSVALVARVLQASGTAIVMPLLMSTTLTLVQPQHRGTVMGLNSIVISVGPAIGPTLSGIIIDAQNWRWVFGGMIPVAAVALIVGICLMPAIGGGGHARLDVPSVLLSIVGFGGIVTAISTVSDLAHGSPIPIASLVLGAIGVCCFVFRQRALASHGMGRALLDLSPFRTRSFTVSVLLIMVAMATLLGTVTVLPLFAQTTLGLSVLATGLMLLPGGIVQGVLSPFVGRLYDRIGPLPLVLPGTILLVAAEWWMSTISHDTTIGMLIAMHVLFSIGMSLVLTPMLTHALSDIQVRLYGHGSAIVNSLQQLAGAVGIAAMIGGLTLGANLQGSPGAEAAFAGVATAFQVGCGIAVIGLACVPFLARGRFLAKRRAR